MIAKAVTKGKIKNNSKTPPKLNWIYLIGVLLLTIIVYSNSLKNDFIRSWDDNLYILQNEIIQDVGFENIKTIFTSIQIDNYSPVTTLILAIEYNISGPEPGPFHITSLVFHFLNILLLFYFVHHLTGKRNVALISSLVFAVHPMFVESIAWIPAQSSIICTMFILGTLISYVEYIRSNFKVKFFFLSILFFLLALMSKSISVTVPILLILIDYFLNRKFTIKNFIEKIPFFVLSIVFGILAIKALGSYFMGDIPEIGFSFLDKIFFSGYLIVIYIIKLIVPFNLSALHYYPEQTGMLPIEYYVLPLLLILVVYAIYKSGSLKKKLIFGLLFYIVSISIVLPLFSYRQTIFAERYLYTGYIGLFIIIGFLYDAVTNMKGRLTRIRKFYPAFLLAALILFFSIYSYNRSKVWKNGVTLFTDVVEKYPRSAKGYGMLGLAKTVISDFEGAKIVYEKGLNLKPDDNLAIMNLAFVKSQMGDYVGAIRDYSKLIEGDYNKSKMYYARGLSKCKVQNYTGGIEDFNKAIELEPDNLDNYKNRGVANNKLKNYKEAIKDFDMVIELNSENAEAYNLRGVAKMNLEDIEGAKADYYSAIRIDPAYTHAYNNLGVLLAKQENYQEALDMFNKTISIDPNHADAYKLRGNIYFVYGNIENACKDWNKAYGLGDKTILGMIKQNCR